MKISMMRIGCAISLFCPFLCFQSFLLEIVPHFDPKNFFYLQNWPSYTFFPTLSMYTASPHIYLSLWDLMLACKIEFLKFWKFYFQVKRLWPLFATLWAIFWWHLCGHMPQIWPYGRNLTIYPHDNIAPKMGVYWKSNKNVVNWWRNYKYWTILWKVRAKAKHRPTFLL